MHGKMSPTQDPQLEKVLDEALKSGDVQSLDGFLQMDIYEGTPIKCSQQFLTKLDKFVKRSLDQKDYKSTSLGFAILYKCGKNLQLPGNKGLSGIIAQGLIKKIVQWFEKCRQLWIQRGLHWDEALLNLSEDLFDALMVVREMCVDGTYQITESFLYPVGQLGVDPRIYILIRKEAIRKFNLILDKMPVELKKERKILTSQEPSDIMLKLAGQILECGDYDFQTALMEALCRMATPYQRKELADRWFSMAHMAKAFTNICDSEFETDCRKFLNLVNGMQGDRRRVYSYPCLEVHLDKHELLIPPDEKLEEFWIDFNLGSHSISFYFSLADENLQEGQWETICVNENEVQSYTVTEKDNRKVFQLNLSETLVASAVEGSNLTIQFSSSLDILQAAHSVYGHSKYKGFVGKTSTSVVKTTVKILMEENSSQVVPESQVSLGESEKNKAPYIPPASSEQMVTPAKMKISESTTIISNSTGRSVHTASSLSSVLPTATSSRKKAKPSLKMVHSCNRKGERCTGDLRTAAKTCSHGTTTRSTKAGVIKEQNTRMAKTSGVVLTGQRILEDSFVPDTQPRTGTNISSNWNKVLVSEMPMMPTEKINTQPRIESYSNLAQHQEFKSSAQGSLVPGSGQKHFHARLIQSLQQVLCEKSQRCAPQKKMPDNRGGSKVTRSSGQFAPTSCSPKEQPSDLAKDKKKHQVPLEAAAAPNKASVKASSSKAMKETTPHKGRKAETSRVLSSKEKRDAEVAGSMVKLISSHYQINSESTAKDTAKDFQQSCVPSLDKRQSCNISWISAAKRHVSGTGRLIKFHDKTATNSAKQGNDIFAFNADTPAGVKGRLNTSSAISSSDNHAASVLHRTTKQGQSTAKKKRYVKKHLFSDTDTDCALTEVSWLRESSRKPKPKVNKYTRREPVKPKEVSLHTSYEIPDVPPPSPVPARGNANKKEPEVKERMRQQRKTVKPVTAPNGQHAGRQRPKRATATSAKNYKEPDPDGSQSKTEKCPVPKKKKSQETCLVVPGVKKTKNSSTDSYRRVSGNNQSDLKNTSGLKKPELKRSDVPDKELVNALEDSVAANQTSVCLASSFIESMRSAERSPPILDITCSPLLSLQGSPLPASLEPACQDTHSPVMLLPKARSIASNKENLEHSSLYSADKKRSTAKTLSAQSCHSLLSLRGQIPEPNILIGPRAEHCLSPAPQCPLSLPTQPLMTSTLLELDKPSMPSPSKSPFPEDITDSGNHCSFGVSAVSQGSPSLPSTKSSGLTKRVKNSPSFALAVSHKTEKTPSSDSELKPHMSGPSRKHHISSSSNSEEDEMEERKKSNMRGERYPRMKPRKLFKSFTEASAESEVNPAMSTSHTVSFSGWEDDVGEGDMDVDEDLDVPETAVNPSNLCQRFSSELKKKFQDRFTMMEFYNKQSLKTVQQHVSSLNVQVNKYRSQTHEQVKKVLLEEIHKLEHNDAVLKEMEKDLSIHWKKQTVAFHTHREQETKRNATLKKAIQSMCPSLEYEQKVFTSQMSLIKKDMKSIQDRLLSEMQEDELQSVKRGLHAVFFPDGARL